MHRKSFDRVSRSVGLADGPWQVKQSLKPSAECIWTIFGSLLWQTLQAETADDGKAATMIAAVNNAVLNINPVYDHSADGGMMQVIV
jgi:hypothetical protein